MKLLFFEQPRCDFPHLVPRRFHSGLPHLLRLLMQDAHQKLQLGSDGNSGHCEILTRGIQENCFHGGKKPREWLQYSREVKA
jgi:hypothetical protein